MFCPKILEVLILRHRKYIKTFKFLLLLIIPIILLNLSTSLPDEIKAQDTKEDIEVTPQFKPTKPPKKFIGIWMTSGYGLQPNANSYTVVNKPVTLRTSAGRSIWAVILGLFDTPHYQWWKTTDGKNWTEVPKGDSGKKKNLTITPTEEGTVWYQLDTQYYTIPTIKRHLYSEVAAVHTLPEEVNAIKLDVTTDDDYLYNTSDEISNTTYAHAVPTPENATGVISWSIDDTSLATIDEDGLITANKKDRDGVVTVTGTMTNDDGSSVSGTAKVRIGGGLDDQTVKSGQSATYTLMGNTGGDGDDENTGTITIAWYRYEPGSTKRTQVASGKDDFYTTNPTTMDDDGAYYQAVITLKSGSVSKKLTTNKALLTVIPSGPELEITNKIQNLTYNHSDDTDNLLNNVVNGDQISYHDNIYNKSPDAELIDGNYVIPLHDKTIVNDVRLNGVPVEKEDYSIIHDDDNNTDNLVIKIGNIGKQETAAIDVFTTVAGISASEEFNFTNYAYGSTSDEQIYRQEGVQETINYAIDSFSTDIADIDYGWVGPSNQNLLQKRPAELNLPNNIVNVDDQRRDKTALKVYVSQVTDFINDNGETLQAVMRYYENGSFTDILNAPVLISETTSGEELNSIGWMEEDGLLLYVNNKFTSGGAYQATLNWNFTESI